MNKEQNPANYIGKWMYYRWNRGFAPDTLIHPDEFIKHPNLTGFGLAHCIAIEDDYLVIKTKEDVYRVKDSDRIMLLPTPQFYWNEEVCEHERPEVCGIINNIEWHSKEEEYKYYLIVNGTRKSRRYNEPELRSRHQIA